MPSDAPTLDDLRHARAQLDAARHEKIVVARVLWSQRVRKLEDALGVDDAEWDPRQALAGQP